MDNVAIVSYDYQIREARTGGRMGKAIAMAVLVIGLIAVAGSSIYVSRDRLFGPSKEQKADRYLQKARDEHPLKDLRDTFPQEADGILARMRTIEITDTDADDVVRQEYELIAAAIDPKVRLAAQASEPSIRRIMQDRLAHSQELRRMDVASCARAVSGQEDASPRSASSSDAAWQEFHDMLVAAAEAQRQPHAYARPTELDEAMLRQQLWTILPQDEYEAYVANARPDGIDPKRRCDIGIGVLQALLRMNDDNFGPYASAMIG